MRYHVHRFEKHHLKKNTFNHRKSAFQSISRRSSDNSKFQRKRLPVGIGSFVPYSRRSEGFFKPIKKNDFFEKFTVVYPLNWPFSFIISVWINYQLLYINYHNYVKFNFIISPKKGKSISVEEEIIGHKSKRSNRTGQE